MRLLKFDIYVIGNLFNYLVSIANLKNYTIFKSTFLTIMYTIYIKRGIFKSNRHFNNVRM